MSIPGTGGEINRAILHLIKDLLFITDMFIIYVRCTQCIDIHM